jgi:hypothetical protein
LFHQTSQEIQTELMDIRRAFAVYKSAAFLAFTLCIAAPLASGQRAFKTPEIDVFGGYSYLRLDGTPLGFRGSSNLNGGNLEVAVPVYHDFGIVADFSGHYSSDLQEYNFLIGGQYKFEVKGVHLFGHALGGKARTRLGNIGVSRIEPSSLGGAAMFGGGIEFPWKEKILLRPIQADYLINGAFGDRFNNVRISTGLVFVFGKKAAPTPGL